MIFQHSRFQIWNQVQHPYRHTLADFAYTNNALPSGASNVESALNYILAVLYPQTKENVATVGDLPAVGNSFGDYRIVNDDGDGKSAAYRWEHREGEAVASWHKIYDVDWSTDGILAAVTDVTQYLYVSKTGRQDLDSAGNVIVGTYAGQTIFGGIVAGENLTLNANAGDGVGAQSGFVQIDSDFRPVVNATYDLSTTTERWKDLFLSNSSVINTMTISTGSIIDSTGAISFGNENLTTTGNINGAIITATTSLVVDDTVNTVTVAPGSYTDSTGLINFGASNLSTSGTLGAGVTTLTEALATLIFDPNVGGTTATILSSLGAISFGDENLSTTGSITSGSVSTNSFSVDNINLDGNTISITNLNGDLNLSANGTGSINLSNELDTNSAINSTSTISALSVEGGNLLLSGNSLTSVDLNGNINLDPNGTGGIVLAASTLPSIDDTHSLGSTLLRYNDLFINGNIGDGTNTIATSTLLSLRNSAWRDSAQTLPAQNGDTLFYDTVTSTWLASHPDTEITHSELSGLTTSDAGHTQFAMLAGRTGGQVLQGGTAASENLDLESTSNATKGLIRVLDNIVAFTNASFAVTWSGTDIGGSSNYFRDVYTRGEFRGFRLENFTSGTLPASSAQNIGRTVFATDNNKAYIDTGTSFIVLGVSKFVADTAWDGIITTLNTNVSANIQDARNAQWQLMDNANDFEIMNVTIKATSASNVRVEVAVPLAVGSYRLIGIE